MSSAARATATAHERLLDAAEATLLDDGFTSTGVDAVVAAAGVATATLYHRFGNKDGLLVAVLERRLERWRVTWEAEIAAAADPTARLLAVFPAARRFREAHGLRRGCPFLATAVELPDGTHASAAVRVAETTHLDARLRELANELGVADPAGLAARVRLAYDGALASVIRGDPGDAGFERAQELARLAVDAATR